MEKDAGSVWKETLGSLKEFLPPDTNDIWLQSCEAISLESGVLRIDVPNPFARENIERKILGHLEDFLRMRGFADSVELVIKESPKDHERARSVMQPQSHQSPNGLIRSYVFENFVVGKSNRFAHAASLAVSDAPGVAYNPLFIWGGVGLGKTHLMHAIANHIERTVQGARTLYVTSEKFTNDVINSIRNNTMTDFRAQYRGLDVLLVDDIQFIGGKDSTQEEFFHTFNDLHNKKKQVVICSDSPPKEIKGLEERLISRFEWGLVVDIQSPDFETRMAILQKKAELKGYRIPEEVILFLAQNIPSNIRELEGALNRVLSFSEISAEPMTAENVAVWLKDVLRNQSTGELSINTIQQLTAESFGITVDDLVSTKRTADLALARQIAMYIARYKLNDISLQQIGNAFNKKDHTTVLHADKKIKALLKTEIRVKTIVDNILNRL